MHWLCTLKGHQFVFLSDYNNSQLTTIVRACERCGMTAATALNPKTTEAAPPKIRKPRKPKTVNL